MTDNDTRIWPDDARRAAVTLAFAAATASDGQMDDVIASINESVHSGRPVQYVLALIGALTAGLEEQFSNPTMVTAYQQTAAQYQAHEDQLRCDGEWRET
jgi:hypothetical protein